MQSRADWEAADSSSRKNQDRQEMNHQKQCSGRREQWEKQGVAGPGLLQGQVLQVPASHVGILDVLFPPAECWLASACCGECPELADAPTVCCHGLAAPCFKMLAHTVCYSGFAVLGHPLLAAAESRKAGLFHRGAFWFSSSRWERMVAVFPHKHRISQAGKEL